jgi:hypothetical protein
MANIYAVGVNPVSKVIAGSLTAGATTITIPNSTSLPTIPAGSFETARITDPSGAPTENIQFTRSGTTLTIANSGTLANSYSAGAAIDFDVISQPGLDQIKQDSLSGSPHGSTITAAGALTLGIMNFVSLTSAAATLTIANGVYDGQLVGIQVLDTNTKLVTLDPAGSTPIDGSLTRIMWANEVAWLAWDNTNTMWRKVAGRSIAMGCTMSLSANSAFPTASTWEKCALNTSNFDNTGLMADTTNHVINILRPGNYNAIFAMSMTGTGTSLLVQAAVYGGASGTTPIYASFGAGPNTYGGALADGSLVAALNDKIAAYGYTDMSTPFFFGATAPAQTLLTVTEILSW